MKRSLALLLALATGCTHSGATPSTPGTVSVEVAPVSPSSPVTPAAALPAEALPAVACDFRGGFHGMVAGQDAFLRLEQTGGDLAGRYFYARIGADLALTGSVSPSGVVELVEGDTARSTGRFTGRCDARSGALSGIWSNGKAAQPFRFDRVGPAQGPIAAEKRLRLVRSVQTMGPFGMKRCSYEQIVLEIFGAGSPEAERKFGRQSVTAIASPLLSKETYADAELCESGLEASFGERVVDTFAGLVTIEGSGGYTYDGAAHPANFAEFSRKTYDLNTGDEITALQVFTKLPKDLVDRCVAAYQAAPDGGPIEADGGTFALTPRGVQVFGTSYGHALAALTGQGPVLTYAALLREGALRADSPARRAWEGVAPAKQGDAGCITVEGKPLR